MKNILRKAKKGFTIVELVIVIGVIAILSAILIPTFVNLTDKANDAALQSNCANAYTEYYTVAIEDDNIVDVGRENVYLSLKGTPAEAKLAYVSFTSTSTDTNEKWREGSDSELTLTSVYGSAAAENFSGYYVYYVA